MVRVHHGSLEKSRICGAFLLAALAFACQKGPFLAESQRRVSEILMTLPASPGKRSEKGLRCLLHASWTRLRYPTTLDPVSGRQCLRQLGHIAKVLTSPWRFCATGLLRLFERRLKVRNMAPLRPVDGEWPTLDNAGWRGRET
jgi:hypothetical protein